MSTKDFAKSLVDTLVNAAAAFYTARNGTDGEAAALLDMNKARNALVQALTVPDHSENFPDMRDQFAMAAPEAPLWKFEPMMPMARPAELPPDSDDFDAMPANWKECSAWDIERTRQIIIQWPFVWADSQMAARKATSTPEGAA